MRIGRATPAALVAALLLAGAWLPSAASARSTEQGHERPEARDDDAIFGRELMT
jgi:hypothetical protein